MRVGVVILNWNNGPVTLSCLEAVNRLSYANRALYVVDNGSTDDSREAIRAWFRTSKIHVVETGFRSVDRRLFHEGDHATGLETANLISVDRNLGYGGGNNAGIGLALAEGADAVWILNNDARPAEDALDLIVSAAGLDSRAGIIGACVLDDDGTDHVQCVGGGRYRWQTSQTTMIGRGMEFDAVANARLDEPDFVTGAAIFVTRALILDIGGFEEGYHLYCEEIDLAARARRRGWKLRVSREAQVRHQHGSTMGSNADVHLRSQSSFYYGARSSMLLTRKFRPILSPLVAIARIGFAMSLYSRGMAASARAVLRGTADGVSAQAIGDRTLRATLGQP